MKNKKLILWITLLILLVTFTAYFLYIHQLYNPEPLNGSKPPEGIVYEDAPVINGNKIYSNKTLGIEFKYPIDWGFEKNYNSMTMEDPITHGAIIKNNKIYTTFNKALLSPDFSKNSTYISISAVPNEDSAGYVVEGLSIREQIKKIRCEKERGCNKLKTPSGVEYFKYPLTCGDIGGCVASVVIPTGKYIVSIDLMGGYKEDLLEKESIFNNVIASITLN